MDQWQFQYGRVCLVTIHVLSIWLRQQYLSALSFFKLTFGKWCRCLHNVCYLKLKKRRYLDKCRLSALAESTGSYYPKRNKTQLSFSQVEIINHTQNISPRQTSNLGLTLQQLLTRVEAIFLKGIAIINDSQMVVISSNLLYKVQLFRGTSRFLSKCKLSRPHKSQSFLNINCSLSPASIMLDQILNLINIGSNMMSAYHLDLFQGGLFHFDIDPRLAQQERSRNAAYSVQCALNMDVNISHYFVNLGTYISEMQIVTNLKPGQGSFPQLRQQGQAGGSLPEKHCYFNCFYIITI